MEAAPRLREPGGLPAPAILIGSDPHSRFGGSDRSVPFGIYSSSMAMTIPGTESRIDAPPPLPPPRFINEPPPYRPGDGERDYDHGLDVGSIDDRPNYKRNGRPERDEGYHSLPSLSSSRSQCSLPSISTGDFRWLQHNRYQFQSGADAFVDMKRKLDPLKTFDNKSPPGRSLLSASSSDLSARSAQESKFPPLSLPYHTKVSVLDSPDRYTQTPLHSAAMSPRSAPFPSHHHAEHRSPNGSEPDRSPPHRTRRTNSGSLPDDTPSAHGSTYGGDEMEIEETSSMRKLRLDDQLRADGHTVGMKRRASSPPGDEPLLHSACSQSSLLRRRDANSRGSPTPRLSTIPQGSVSSVSSASRAGSFTSKLSLVTGSSMSSMNSYGGRSPGGLSTGGLSPITTDLSCGSPFTTPMSLDPSPRGAMGRGPHQRNVSDSRQLASPRKANDIGKPSGAKMQGFFMCECCPKKPKKFETRDELSAHEAEKQYECSFCGNRFKNKNEAERHQNSLHVRRHSWSCSALIGYDRAFHESTIRPGEADTCGYCGDEFARSGRGPGASAPRHVSDQDWEERVRHLQEVHKFRECNSSKKFYRADHFRQHLKHSHAGTSGKWTNMLENACMLDEDPVPR